MRIGIKSITDSNQDVTVRRMIVLRLRRITAFLTGILLVSATVLAPVTDVLAKNETTAVKKSNYVIKDMSSANSALSSLANDQSISALVYLKDA